jgi:excisionase family DNA binding protein
VKNDIESLTMTIPEFARYMRISIQTAYRLARQGVLPTYKVGRQVRLRRSDLDKYISAGGSVRIPERRDKGS